MLISRAALQTVVLSLPRPWHWKCMGRTAMPLLRATYGGTPPMELTQALKFSYTSVAQEIVCDTDTIADLCGTLDRLGVHTAYCGRNFGASGPDLWAGYGSTAPRRYRPGSQRL